MTKVEVGVPDGVDIESLMDRFQKIADGLESGLPLEEHVKLYEEGCRLEAVIRAELAKAERRMVEIINEDGTTSPFDGGRMAPK